ncbi:hypothetical protein GCM10011430_14930 [Oxalicibacterium solurbis]|uniref:Uncharacterized protein n=1 Tax=Oxalicibacterium solurbis TaxID=69280 RepID=A0A8J3F5Q0_9BURK|nr:hypothetical protein GCM10011430_14930 [Oxalicibacterium solurbis]
MKTQYIACDRKSHVFRFRAPESKKPHGRCHAAGKEAEGLQAEAGGGFAHDGIVPWHEAGHVDFRQCGTAGIVVRQVK